MSGPKEITIFSLESLWKYYSKIPDKTFENYVGNAVLTERPKDVDSLITVIKLEKAKFKLNNTLKNVLSLPHQNKSDKDIDTDKEIITDANAKWFLSRRRLFSLIMMLARMLCNSPNYTGDITKIKETYKNKETYNNDNGDLIHLIPKTLIDLIPEELHLEGVNIDRIKLNIVGSENIYPKVSDIDIGVIGSGELGKCQLSVIIQLMESLHVYILGTALYLDADIEHYANFLEDKDGKSYLSSKNLQNEHFETLLLYAFASILRSNPPESVLNTVFDNRPHMVQPENNALFNAVTSFTTNIKECIDICRKNATKPLCLTNTDTAYQGIIPDIATNINVLSKSITDESITDESITEKSMAKKSIEIYNTTSKPWVTTQNLKTLMETYYVKVQNAETELSNIIINDNTSNISAANIVKLCICFSEADLCRRESFVLPFTVMHVVTIMQKNKTPTDETCQINNDNTKDTHTHTVCLMNEYAYTLSILENYGYMLKYHNLINQHPEKEALYKTSRDKYTERIIDDLMRINTLHKSAPTNNGGRARRTRRNTRSGIKQKMNPLPKTSERRFR